MRTIPLLLALLLTACGTPDTRPPVDAGADARQVPARDASGCEEWTIPADGDCPWQTFRQCGDEEPVCVKGCEESVPEYCSRS